jgi:myo-inositol-1(or 4)-monophosphatase
METRLDAARRIAEAAGALGMHYFREISALEISPKGHQDLVSNADLAVETFVREQIDAVFPDDGIVGEEHQPKPSQSGWTWVVDPIDGTANFVRGLPQWCVILAVVAEDQTQLGVIHDPNVDETHMAERGGGAFLNGRKIRVSPSKSISDGSVGVGLNGRTDTEVVSNLIAELVKDGGIFFRNASGGLMLAYVASGRLIGYTEPHMNAWDCLAGQLLIEEAGGQIEQQSAGAMLASGGRVVAGCPGIFEPLLDLSLRHYSG